LAVKLDTAKQTSGEQTMRNLSRLNSITAKFINKSKQVELNATDVDMRDANGIWLAGYHKLGDFSGRLILGSTNEITEAQTKLAVPALTQQAMNAYGPSFTTIKVEQKAKLAGSAPIHYASVIGIKPAAIYREASTEVLAKCKVISALQYLDTELDKVWDKKEIAGKPYLVRMNEADPEEILKSALLANTDSNYRTDCDNFILTSGARPGNFVHFFGMTATVDETGNLTPFMEVAQVVENHGDSLAIRIEENGFTQDAIISAHAVKSVIVASGEMNRQDVLDYLYKAYGPQWAELVKQTGAFGVDSKGNV